MVDRTLLHSKEEDLLLRWVRRVGVGARRDDHSWTSPSSFLVGPRHPAASVTSSIAGWGGGPVGQYVSRAHRPPRGGTQLRHIVRSTAEREGTHSAAALHTPLGAAISVIYE